MGTVTMPRRRARNRTRKSRNRAVRRIIVVSVEGRETEKKFFDTLNHRLTNCTVTYASRKWSKSEPMQVLDDLIAHRSKQIRSNERADGYWILIDHDRTDVDELRKVFAKARKHHCCVADSNPCFEIWLLLHLKSLDKYKRLEASGDVAKCTPSSKALERIDPTYDHNKKGKWDASPYMDKIDTAIENAERIDRTQADEPLNRLGTRVYKLIESIRNSSTSPHNPSH